MTSDRAIKAEIARHERASRTLYGRVLSGEVEAHDQRKRIAELELMVVVMAARTYGAGYVAMPFMAVETLRRSHLACDPAEMLDRLRRTGQAGAWRRLGEAYERDAESGDGV